MFGSNKKNNKEVQLIKESGLFDFEYYCNNGVDFKSIDLAIQDYLSRDNAEKLNPSEAFNVSFYLEEHGDVKKNGIDPLLHYINHGKAEGRIINENQRNEIAQVDQNKFNINNSEKFENLKAGDKHYKAYVGPPKKYDLVGAMQFNILTSFGLRDYHKILDIGCGSLRSGKMLIPFLRKGNYYGVEPNNWLIEDGIKYELGQEIISLKNPSFSNSSEFEFQVFNEQFDFLIAQSIFSHASSNQISKCLKEVKSVMKEEGLFLATFINGENDYTGSEWVYPGCVTYSHNYILDLVEKQNLETIKTKWLHPNGQSWYVIFHPENRKSVNEIVDNLFTSNMTE